ncbi:MAG: hypothetical protein J4G09_05125 [Proteobacteria bacterium]|nr:hypothetical protein [Pseudomonadota bacterium]
MSRNRPRRRGRFAGLAAVCGLAAALAAGCASGDRVRQATEQRLKARAVDMSVARLVVPDELRNRSVAILAEAGSSVEPADAQYLRAAIEAHFAAREVRIVPEQQADFTVVALVGVLGTDERDLKMKTPKVPLNYIGLKGFELPRVPLFSFDRQKAQTEISVTIRDRDGALYATYKPVRENMSFDVYKLFFVPVCRSGLYGKVGIRPCLR